MKALYFSSPSSTTQHNSIHPTKLSADTTTYLCKYHTPVITKSTGNLQSKYT